MTLLMWLCPTVQLRRFSALSLLEQGKAREQAWAAVKLRSNTYFVWRLVSWTVAAVLILLLGRFSARSGARPTTIAAVSVGFALLVVAAASTVPIWAARRDLEAKLRLELIARHIPVCLECGYLLRDLQGDVCPECGWRLDDQVRRLVQRCGTESSS